MGATMALIKQTFCKTEALTYLEWISTHTSSFLNTLDFIDFFFFFEQRLSDVLVPEQTDANYQSLYSYYFLLIDLLKLCLPSAQLMKH